MLVMGEQPSSGSWSAGDGDSQARLVTISVVLVARQQPPDDTSRNDRSYREQVIGLTSGPGGGHLRGDRCSGLPNRSDDHGSQPDPKCLRQAAGGCCCFPGCVSIRRFRSPDQRSPVGLGCCWPPGWAPFWGSLRQVVLQQLPLGVGITVLSTAPVMAVGGRAEGDHPQAAGWLASDAGGGGASSRRRRVIPSGRCSEGLSNHGD